MLIFNIAMWLFVLVAVCTPERYWDRLYEVFASSAYWLMSLLVLYPAALAAVFAMFALVYYCAQLGIASFK